MENFQKKRRLKWLLLGSFAVVLIVGFALMSSMVASKFIKGFSEDFYGFQIKWDRFEFNLLDASAKLHNFQLIPKALRGYKKGEAMIAAKKISVDVRLLPLIFQKTISVSEVELKSPQIKVVRYRDGTNSLKRFLPIIKVSDDKVQIKKGGGKEEEFSTHVILDEINIKKGKIDFKDEKMGSRIVLNDVDLVMTELNSKAGLKGKPSHVKVAAKLAETGGRIKLNGTINFFEEGFHFDLKQKSRGLPITYFRPYYQSEVPVLITGGTVSVSSKMKSRKSYLTSSHYVQIANLQVKGRKGARRIMEVPAKVVIAFIQSRKGTVDMNIQVNGNLEEGNFSVSKQFSRNLFQSIAAGAQKEMGSEFKETFKKTKEDLKKSFRKINPFK